jgi:hypothetical protein
MLICRVMEKMAKRLRNKVLIKYRTVTIFKEKWVCTRPLILELNVVVEEKRSYDFLSDVNSKHIYVLQGIS